MLKLAVLVAVLALPAAPTHYVTDAANVLDDARERALNEKLADYARAGVAVRRAQRAVVFFGRLDLHGRRRGWRWRRCQ